MIFYIVNEDLSNVELARINSAISPLGHVAHIWTVGDSNLPAVLDGGLIVVRSTSTLLEEQRAIAILGVGKRLVCLYIQPVPTVSPLVQSFCSTEIGVGDNDLGKALEGTAEVHKDFDGNPTKKNPQKPHRC